MTTAKRIRTYNEDKELGFAILIAEDEQGKHEPIGVAVNIREGKEMAQHDMRGRIQSMGRGQDADICPYIYKLWARGAEGKQHVVASWLSTGNRTYRLPA